MKTNKPKVQKKVAKKAAKKDLEKTLTDRILEVVQQLAHDAEKIGVDIKKVGRNVSKDLLKRFSPVKAVAEKKIKPTPVKAKKLKAIPEIKVGKATKTKVKNDVAKAHKTVKAAAKKAKSVSRSVKVVPIVSVEKVEQAIAKPATVKKETAIAKKPVTKTTPAAPATVKKPAVKKASAKTRKEDGVN